MESTDEWIPLWAKVIGISGLVVGLGGGVIASGAIPPLNRALARTGMPGVRDLGSTQDEDGAE